MADLEGLAAAATAEYQQIATDPTHPMHEGYLRRDPKVEAYIDSLYKKAYNAPATATTPPTAAPIPDGGDVAVPQPLEGPALLQDLQQWWGADFP